MTYAGVFDLPASYLLDAAARDPYCLRDAGPLTLGALKLIDNIIVD